MLIFVMIEDLVHHRLRESHHAKTRMMNLIRLANRKIVELYVNCIIIIQATRGHGWPKASHDHGSAEGQPGVAV